MAIQIDMFEVQLGAGLLMQFDAPDGVVRVLADAGVHASGYAKDHVKKKLPAAFTAMGDARLRIDLVIGTHYDADHLDGLPPIISDSTYEIGEVWLPPVANDTQPHTFDGSPGDADLLPLQLKGDGGGEVLKRYLGVKADICNKVRALEEKAGSARKVDSFSKRDGPVFDPDRAEPSQWRDFFVEHRNEARALTGEGNGCHADIDIDDQPELLSKAKLEDVRYYRYFDGDEDFRNIWASRSGLAFTHGLSLAHIRRRAAEDAINALALDAVVTAARVRDVTIRCAIIPDGTPRRFVWSKADKRFEPNENGRSDGPILTLLGPSQALVKKHWDKLPLGDYLVKVAFTSVPLKGISASNELSYVCVLESEEQRVLVSGDAGFVDFKPKRNAPFFPKLIDALKSLHVVQVAHHGGRNHSFYNGLLDAREKGGVGETYLLLSHAVKDAKRPSDVFGLYIAQVRTAENTPKLLFTSEPKLTNVKDFTALIAPVAGTKAEKGDIRLKFADGGWQVLAHSVSVA